ncbi:MAG: efflux RND transporter periplasmic adaptor subunit [Chloroflexi bacterium]|nr:efflux RND transporter periplasmic adaptor subunit [Chloroflexota bacterium]
MRKTYIAIGAALILILVVAVMGIPGFTGSVMPTVEAQAPETARVERVTLSDTIEATGTIAARQTGYLVFRMSGTVQEVLVEVGDVVAAGQELARLDTSDLEYEIALREKSLIVQQASYDDLVADPTDTELAQARANLASAQSQLLSAQNNLETAPNQETISCSNLDSLLLQLEDAQTAYDEYLNDGYTWDATFQPDPNAAVSSALRSAQTAYDVALAQCSETTPISQYEVQLAAAQASFDQAQASLDSLLSGPTELEITSAEAQLEQARLELENARSQLEDAVLVAPFSGVVADVAIDVSDIVSSNLVAVTLLDTSQLHVEVDVDELDIANLAVGLPATIIPDALDDVVINGEVARITPLGRSSNNVVTYPVRVDLTDIGDLPIRVGMTTGVEINVEIAANVLAVPTDAIQREGTNEFVDVYNADGTTQRIAITSGRSSNGMTEISGEIAEGAIVVVPQQVADSQDTQNGNLGGPGMPGGFFFGGG